MELYDSTTQTLATQGSALTFDTTVIPGGCSIIHREGSGIATLRGLGYQCRSRFRVTFDANISGAAAGQVALAIAIDGEIQEQSIMQAYPAAANEYFNVSSTRLIDVPLGSEAKVSIVNATTTTAVVQNANLIVERVA